MQPRIPRSYALAVPTGRLTEADASAPLHGYPHCPRRSHCRWRRQAHAADLKAEVAHDVRYLRYGVSEADGKIFCLVDAPSAEAANTVHREAHGLVADDVFEVQEGL